MREASSAGPSVKLAIGPANQAGQARRWAAAVASHAGVPAVSFANDGWLAAKLKGVRMRERADVSVPHYKLAPQPIRAAVLRNMFRGVTHLLNESNAPVFGRPGANTFEIEIEYFQAHQVRTGYLFHGSEIRDPDKHAESNQFSYFRDAPAEWVAILRAKSARNRAAAERSGMPLFVSTPDLLVDLPTATLLPICVDVDAWSRLPRASRAVPRVLHQPSRSKPPIKGTAYIEPVLAELEAAGLIERIHSAQVSHSAMVDLVASADIVIDQIQTGSYGVAAVEAMAAGRVVVGNLSRSVRNRFPGGVPIVDADPETLKTVLRELVGETDRLEQLGHAGQQYARRWHDGTESAAAITGFLNRE